MNVVETPQHKHLSLAIVVETTQDLKKK